MKKILVLIVATMMHLGAFSQKSDTICVSKPDLVRKLKQLEDLKVKAVELEQLSEQFRLQSSLVSSQGSRIVNLEAQTRNYTGQIALKDETLRSLNKALRSQKRKTIVVGVAGIVLAGSLVWLMK